MPKSPHGFRTHPPRVRGGPDDVLQGRGGEGEAVGLDLDELVTAFAATMPFSLDEFQVEAILLLERSAGVLVSAPTSSGKTVIAEYVVWRTLGAPPALRRHA